MSAGSEEWPMETPKRLNPFDRIRAVVFDFDGTLAVLNIDFSMMRAQVDRLMKDFSIGEEPMKERYLLEIIDEAFDLLAKRNLSDAERFYQEAHQILHEIEMAAAGEGNLIPGTEKVLRNLKEKGIKVGIVTRNCEDAVRKVFPRIDEFCDVFISRNSVKKVKPHPDHLTLVMKILDVSGEEAMMVGDHPIDIQAGKRVGMKTIGVLTGRTRKEEFEQARADYVLKEASEVSVLLQTCQS